jgi:allantoinase
MKRTLIRGGAVVTSLAAEKLDILIEGEHIAGLLESGASVQAEAVIDASGLVVLPGAIDGHAHFSPRDPDADHPVEIDNEGFYHGGCGAAAGGVTTIVEMPQAYPPTVSKAAFERKMEISRPQAIVDYALWGGIQPGASECDIQAMADAGAAGFKAYMCSGDPDLPMLKDAEILAALDELKDTGIMLGLHTENESLLKANVGRLKATGRTDPLAHAESRPAILESVDVDRAIYLAEATGGWAHIVHMNTIESARLVRRAQARGLRVTSETCPHYLALDLDDLAQRGPYAKCVPALRSRAEVEALWEFVADGTIDAITSDHCGWTRKAKEGGGQGIWGTANGLTAIQTLLPVVITEARKRGFGWQEIARWTATNPARLWHLDSCKGSIRVGADADLVLVDVDSEWTVEAGDLLHAQKWSPFEGKVLGARVVQTLLRGTIVFDDSRQDRIRVEPGFGQFIPRAA